MNGQRIAGGLVTLTALGVLAACGGPSLYTAQPQINVVTSPPRIVSVGTCPKTVTAGQFTFPAAPATELVPSGADNAMACRYEGLNDPHPHRLATSVRLTPAQIRRLTASLNTAQVAPKGRAISCPADFGTYDVVAFGYVNRGPVDVLVSTSGCRGARNGTRTTTFAQTAVDQLGTVVGTPAPPTSH
ncbi:MAG TPA: hypothetical protein VHF06_00130 [Pseudonocardiaceae bacterium]|jgi:hypothetical protein|nr:hypothetical protein [Pseudonocardiaceae bacterium]